MGEMQITQAKLDAADLVLLVDSEGNYEWSAKRPTDAVIQVLHRIADSIEQKERTNAV